MLSTSSFPMYTNSMNRMEVVECSVDTFLPCWIIRTGRGFSRCFRRLRGRTLVTLLARHEVFCLASRANPATRIKSLRHKSVSMVLFQTSFRAPHFTPEVAGPLNGVPVGRAAVFTFIDRGSVDLSTVVIRTDPGAIFIVNGPHLQEWNVLRRAFRTHRPCPSRVRRLTWFRIHQNHGVPSCDRLEPDPLSRPRNRFSTRHATKFHLLGRRVAFRLRVGFRRVRPPHLLSESSTGSNGVLS